MRMRRRSESIPDVSISYLCAQMSLSQKSDRHPLGTRMAWEEDPSIVARQSRPRPKDADLRGARLAQSGHRMRAVAKRTFGPEMPRAERDSEHGLRFSC
jgi:hypothetical protein